MPQLDKLIFFFENLGFVMSFFGLVFFNQYIFYPKLLQGVYIRRFLVIHNNNEKLLRLFLLIKPTYFSMTFKFVKNTQSTFLVFAKNLFLKLAIWVQLKLKKFKSLLNLFLNKFIYLFSFFFEIYRSYTIEFL